MTALQNSRLLGPGFDVLRPEIPDDLVCHDDGRWECSAKSLAQMQQWFRRFGLALDVCCRYEDLAEQLQYMRRAAAMLPHLDNPKVAPRMRTPYWNYLKDVLAGNPDETAATREATILITYAKRRRGVINAGKRPAPRR